MNQISLANGKLTITNSSVFFMTVGGCFVAHELFNTIKYLAKEDKLPLFIMTLPTPKYEIIN